ncbi:MAG: potassium-transporting ATPase KdpC subunit [Frankiaceae bacterium]|jgi:K+-transporting ATPase ATPase C chain|nr:potassium-transporting ATPase KdpC subunit [Frankiaceae bacterium]
MRQVLAALRVLLVLTLLTGVAFPLAVLGVGRVAFSRQADGSLVRRDGHVVGSSLLAQPFDGDRYFHPRPSAVDYVGSGASNLGPNEPKLLDAIAERHRDLGDGAPADALTASGSGLDPHISPANAVFQAPRVAAARGLPLEQVRALIAEHTERRTLGFLGEDRVNVLMLNLALAALDDLMR